MAARYELSNLDMDEVSFVDMGDDPEAKICLFKRAGGVVEENDTDAIDGEIVDAEQDGHDLFVTTDVGKVYSVDAYSTGYDEGEEVLVVEKATLLYDPEDVDADETPVESTGLMEKFMERLVGMFGSSPSEVEKGKFAQAMQASIADQAYSELSAMTSALKGAIDADLYGGADANSLIESVDEFSETLKKAITEKWTKGQLIGKAADPELVARASRRDRELLGGGNTDEGGASGGVNAAVSKADGEGNEGGETVAGMDRSQMTPGQIAYQDALESGMTPEQAAQAQADVEAQGAEQGAGSPEAEAPAEEVAAEGAPGDVQGEAAAAQQNPGIAPEEVQGDDGTHVSPFEKMLKGVPEPIAQVLRSQQAEIQKYAAREEEQTYVTKARGFQHLPINPVEMGPVLQRIAKGQTGAADESYVLDVLRSAEEMAKQGGALMSSAGVGMSGSSRAQEGSAEAEVMQKARQVASDKGIPLEIAFAEVRKDPSNQALVSRYNEEVQ